MPIPLLAMLTPMVDRPLRRATAVLIVVALALTSCGGGGAGDEGANLPGAPTTSPGRLEGTLTVKTLHSVEGEHYRYAKSGGTITVTAPRSNHESELAEDLDRSQGVIGEAFWASGQPKRTDQQVCTRLDSVVDASTTKDVQALLADPERRHLPGIALRIDPGVDGAPTHAITVVQRLRSAGIWAFDVATLRIDDAAPAAVASPKFAGTADFGDVVGTIDELGTAQMTTTMKPPPWNLCARVIGTTVTVKIWVGSDEPAWTDTRSTREVKLSPSWVFPGYAGGYELGLSPGQSSKFTGLLVTAPY